MEFIAINSPYRKNHRTAVRDCDIMNTCIDYLSYIICYYPPIYVWKGVYYERIIC